MKNKIVIFLSLSAACVSSQNYVDILKLNANTTPANTFDTSASKTTVKEIGADLTVPFKINHKFSLITGLIYENIQTKLFAEGNTMTFGSSTLKIGTNIKFNETWSATAVLLPKFASDYVSFGAKDFQMGGIAIAKYKKRDDLVYKFGLYYNTELFGPFFVPMAGLYYLSENKKFETNLMLPLQADVNYQFIPFVHAGVNFNGQIRTYHLNGMSPQHPGTYVARCSNEFFLYLKFNLSKSLSLQTKVGRSFGRSYRVYDENDRVSFGLPATFIGHKRQQLNSDFSDGLLFQFSLLYRFNLDKS
ncbi:MAG TPA: DUF6268 family outer membrane beta-barrel protein [Bacteroidia bacterium]|nr:DUF6268 family outer membrane beta-barrel protein [Bacteroidia bacterium]